MKKITLFFCSMVFVSMLCAVRDSDNAEQSSGNVEQSSGALSVQGDPVTSVRVLRRNVSWVDILRAVMVSHRTHSPRGRSRTRRGRHRFGFEGRPTSLSRSRLLSRRNRLRRARSIRLQRLRRNRQGLATSRLVSDHTLGPKPKHIIFDAVDGEINGHSVGEQPLTN